jgi:hypothetical protein
VSQSAAWDSVGVGVGRPRTRRHRWCLNGMVMKLLRTSVWRSVFVIVASSSLWAQTPPGWKTYVNRAYGFSIEYPPIYKRARLPHKNLDMHLTNVGSFTRADEVHDVEENQEDPDRAKINRDGAAAEAAIANHPEISKIPHVMGVAIDEVLDAHQRYAGLRFVVQVDYERNVKAVRGAVPKYLEGFPVVVMAVPRIKHLQALRLLPGSRIAAARWE